MGRVVAQEPSRATRWRPEPWDTWWHRTPPEQRGGAQSHGTWGRTGALPNGTAMDPMLRDT
jgi:hypothetical protein